MNILILGPQGSGKGTQAKAISQEMGFFHFEAGEILRKVASKDRKIKEYIKKGKLVPDEEAFRIFEKFLRRQIKRSKGIIFDGFPRTISQYQLLEEWLAKNDKKVDIAFFLDVSEKEIIRRLSARRMDKKTGRIYNLITNPPGKEVKKEDLVQREDDKPAIIRKRLESYKRHTLPLLAMLEKKKILWKLNGEKPIHTIRDEILRILKTR